jgi:hypothetical protein
MYTGCRRAHRSRRRRPAIRTVLHRRSSRSPAPSTDPFVQTPVGRPIGSSADLHQPSPVRPAAGGILPRGRSTPTHLPPASAPASRSPMNRRTGPVRLEQPGRRAGRGRSSGMPLTSTTSPGRRPLLEQPPGGVLVGTQSASAPPASAPVLEPVGRPRRPRSHPAAPARPPAARGLVLGRRLLPESRASRRGRRPGPPGRPIAEAPAVRRRDRSPGWRCRRRSRRRRRSARRVHHPPAAGRLRPRTDGRRPPPASARSPGRPRACGERVAARDGHRAAGA